MRIVLMALFALFALPAVAQEGERYDNARFAYSISVPIGFVGQGESENGDGQMFAMPGRAIALRVWGGLLGVIAPDFDGAVANGMARDVEGGWNQTYQAVTPRWASWSAVSGGKIFYQRMIALCDGQSYAAFRAEYGVRDRAEMDPVIERLVASLRANAC